MTTGTPSCGLCGAGPPEVEAVGRRIRCHACGWEETRAIRLGGRRRSLIAGLVCTATVLLGLLGWQVVSWSPFGWQALWLRARSAASLADAEDLAELGAICNTLQRYGCSVSAYGRLFGMRPDDPRVVANLALALTRTGAHEAAVRHYERYLELGGGTADTFNGYATSLRALGRKPEAVEWYYRTLQVDPTFLDVTRDLVELLVQEYRSIEALSVIGGFVRRLPSYRPYWNGRIAAIDAALSRTQPTRPSTGAALEIPALGDHHDVPVRLARTGPYEFFLVDTGASLLTLSPEIAQEAKARYRLAGRVVPLRTASGAIVGDGVVFPEIQVGSIWLQDVEGVVCDGCPTLLGQSVLRRFDLRTTRRHSVEFLSLTPR